MKISTFEGSVKGREHPGRPRSNETLALRDAIKASADTGKAMKWDGAAADYQKNSTRLRATGYAFKTPEAPRGYRVHIGLEGNDLTFVASKLGAHTPVVIETPPVVIETPPTKATPRRATPKK